MVALTYLDDLWGGSKEREELIQKIKAGECNLTATQEDIGSLLEEILNLRDEVRMYDID